MINPIVTFIFGIIGGCGVSYFLVSAYWGKKLQQTRQALLNQYDSDLAVAQQHNRILCNRERQWLQEKEHLEQQLSYIKRDRTVFQTHQQAQLEKEKRDRAALEADYDAYQSKARLRILEVREKGINLAVEQTKEIEAEKALLQDEIDQLENNLNQSAIENQQLRQRLIQEQTRLEAEIQSAYDSSGLTFAEIAKTLFQNIVIQRDSATEIDKNRDCASAILSTLRAIDDKKYRLAKRVQATNKAWFESTAPGLKMMRIYFRKNKPVQGKCEVLISHKKDSKTQERDIAWMKRQPS